LIDLSEIRPVSAAEYAEVERKFAKLVGTRQDCILVQGEAILPLEAAARGLGGPGVHALNIVTGPYAALFGDWLRQTGAEVDELAVEFDRAVSAEHVREALSRRSDVELVSIVHAEAATGVVNPLREIAEVVREAGALIVVDAVASVGADPLAIDEWGLDLTVLAAQKALAGPTAASAVVVGERAWERLRTNPAAPRGSILSLLDWKERWVDAGREALPIVPHHVETRLLDLALDRALAEGLDAIVARHGTARDVCRRGLRALRLEPWVLDDHAATAVATTVRVPDGISSTAILDAAQRLHPESLTLAIGAAPGTLSSVALRVNHTGRHATLNDVLTALGSLGLALRSLGVDVDVGGAIESALTC
jgi:aspartate aminotransferase-like enzyme